MSNILPPKPTRRAALGLLLAGGAMGLGLPALAQSTTAPLRSLRPPPRPAARALATGAAAPGAETLIAQANLGGQVGFAVVDLASGRVLEARAPETGLPPASAAKAATAAYALDALGPGARFETRLMATGPIREGVLRGDLVLVGGGDPTLDTDALAAMAQRLREQGLRRVEGRFLVDETALPRIDGIADDQPLQAGYNPAVSGLNLNFNRVHFEWQRRQGQLVLSMDARGTRDTPPVSVIGIEARARDLPVYTYSGSGARESWTVAATALNQNGSRWLPVRRPGIYTGDVLRALCAARGITLPAPQAGRAGAGAEVLLRHRSDAMSDILRAMLRHSTNLTAECVGLAASAARRAPASSLAQSAGAMNQWLAQVHSVPGLALVDHSGLGDGARVTPVALAQMFRALHGTGLPDLLRAHPMRDARGNEIPNHPLQVRAKTGTLNFVSALGGYFTAPGGRRMVFAVLSADLPRRRALQAEDRDAPPGGRAWSGRARALQQALIERWASVYA
jgi:D-alanyl-D-alanine carboxypeptidase/D-alanyl-D-alanine-endopeptidase (penicillin-binding protein 4)